MDSYYIHVLSVDCIGEFANVLLSKNSYFTVFSLITRGAFLLLENQKMIFLSLEANHGPLTLNLSCNPSSLSFLSMREKGQITSHSLNLNQSETCILLDQSYIWNPPEVNLIKTDIDGLYSRLLSMVIAILSGNNPSDLINNLSLVCKLDHNNERLNKNEKIFSVLFDLQNIISRSNFASLPNIIKPLLGWGRGLTPSGDDFIIGVLLTLNRWGHIFQFKYPINKLNHEIIKSAYKKTTTLSANLIECAARGLADEKIIKSLDYLIAGNDDEIKVIRELSDWGNSSGYDTFAGMAITLLALSQ